MEKLYSIIYASSSKKILTENELEIFLQEIRNLNLMHQITGLLLYSEGNFIQLIEGEKKIIQLVYSKIKKDTRHSHVTTLVKTPITERVFPDWTMGFRKISDENASSIPGYNDFISNRKIKNSLDNKPKEIQVLFKTFARINQ